MLSGTVGILLGATLIVLIVAATGQRDAGRVAIRSQKALTLTSRLETSLVSLENTVRAYVRDPTKRSPQPLLDRLDSLPAPARRARRARLRRSQPAAPRARDRRQDRAPTGSVRAASSRSPRTTATTAPTLLSYGSQVEPLNENLRALATQVTNRERVLVGRREVDAEAQADLAIGFGIGGFVLVLAIVGGGTWYLRRAVVRPVLTVAQATGQLAAGDLSTRVPANREDEIGDLARGFNSMADSLEAGQAELELSNAELKRSNAELEQFASVTSHDLQAPLTTISMYAELLERTPGARRGGEPRAHRRHPRRHDPGTPADSRPARVLAGGPRRADPRAAGPRARRQPGARDPRRHDRGQGARRCE